MEKKEKKSKPVSVRLPPHIYDKLHEIAKKEVRSLSEQIQYYIQRSFDLEDARIIQCPLLTEQLEERREEEPSGERDRGSPQSGQEL